MTTSDPPDAIGTNSPCGMCHGRGETKEFVRELFTQQEWPKGVDMLPYDAKDELFGPYWREQATCCQLVMGVCTDDCGKGPFVFCEMEERLCDIMATIMLVPRPLLIRALQEQRNQGDMFTLAARFNLSEIADKFSVDIHTIRMALALWWQEHHECECAQGCIPEGYSLQHG